MNIDRWNSWLTLIANFGVVAGIVFLAIEVRQNEEMLREAISLNRVMARVDDVDVFNEWRGQWVQNEELSRIYVEGRDGDKLTGLDLERFKNLCTSELWLHLKLFERAMAFNDEKAAADAVDILANKLPERPGLRMCWDAEKVPMSDYGSEEFVTKVDERLK